MEVIPADQSQGVALQSARHCSNRRGGLHYSSKEDKRKKISWLYGKVFSMFPEVRPSHNLPPFFMPHFQVCKIITHEGHSNHKDKDDKGGTSL